MTTGARVSKEPLGPWSADEPESKASWVSGWFSEEQGGATCPTGQAIYRVECNGRYCDNLRIFCSDSGDTALGASTYWTPFFSEEQGGGGCATGYAATGIWCNGSFCDNIALECTAVDYNVVDDCSWTPWFSEENNGHGSMPAQYYRMTYMSCSGRYCDNKRMFGCDYDN